MHEQGSPQPARAGQLTSAAASPGQPHTDTDTDTKAGWEGGGEGRQPGLVRPARALASSSQEGSPGLALTGAVRGRRASWELFTYGNRGPRLVCAPAAFILTVRLSDLAMQNSVSIQ